MGTCSNYGIYVAGKISGAHLNPAVTWLWRCFEDSPWRKVIPYSVAQVAGAFTAAALVYAIICRLPSGRSPNWKGGSIFTTFPAFPAFRRRDF